MKNLFQALLWILVGMIASAVLFLVVMPPRGKGVELLPAPTAAPILVHVDGAVQKPGVYPLLRESRAQDAIQAAGGLSPNANSSAVNLAARLKDGDKLIIPGIGTALPPPTASTPSSRSGKTIAGQTATPSGPVNLNTATIEELQTLPGIGATRAQDIIDYRDSHGGFKTINEIENVSGIGPSTFEKLKDRISVQ